MKTTARLTSGLSKLIY